MLKQFAVVITATLLLAGFPAVSAQDSGQSGDQTPTATPVTLRDSAPDPTSVRLVQVVDGFDRPLFVTNAGDGSERLFVVEQSGKIWIVKDDILRAPVFLDVGTLLNRDVFSGGYTERGLLGLAFHPNFAENGIFFIDYTDLQGSQVIARYHVMAGNPDQADPNSAQILLTVPEPYANHNGGMLAFGPDGYLYIGLGDGGSAGDPQNNGQNPNTLLGTILRLDVDGEGSYTIPPDNPFVNGGGAPEVWAWGLRNPWRFSFDRATGDLYIADVGQNAWEEVDFQPAGSPGGQNYGWNIYEGNHPYLRGTPPKDMVYPIAEYDHSHDCSISGGYVYRGEAIPDLQGVYLFGDYCSGTIRAAYRDASGAWQMTRFMQSGRPISGFGQDEQGELYVVNYTGVVQRLVPAQ